MTFASALGNPRWGRSAWLPVVALLWLTSATGCAEEIGRSDAEPLAVAEANPCSANPCNPCAATNPCNPCAGKNPCGANPCNPCGVANPCNPCAAKNPCNPCGANPCGGGKVDARRFVQPAGVALATGSPAELVARGEALWRDGSLSRNGAACATCHVGGYAMMLPSFAKPFPHRVAMPHQLGGVDRVSAAEMVQFCMIQPMQAEPFPWDSVELAALTAYVEHLQPGYTPAAAPAANPCNPCGAKTANPCAANTCNPCAGKNPCAAANPCGAPNPCNPCGAVNPCNPCGG